ncbi:uncharacterized protein B0H64DRAFT_155323 [Chaetomium fimeti]|uniref:Aminoglycoside phosphotransferase domain-containing protein n=1 Tax=Chaetomium fimeti TaxID=1854472 RepID=A0AAE0HHJ5_9PEZI|nr:hypothetical protein B0H64DRAFT_155323 [Chaetomium fimeti]
MGDTDKPKGDPPASSSVDKRDREHGMFQDSLVMKQSDELEDGFREKLGAFFDEGRLLEIYEFIMKHRPGKPVRPGRRVRGSYNAVFPLEFRDGSAAALRVRIAGQTAFPDEAVRVEVATLRYIEKMTSIPVPHVYHWGTAAENPLGLGPFIIMDYIFHDKKLEDLLVDPTVPDGEGDLDFTIPSDQLGRLYRQAAKIILQLSKLEMPRIGSLQQQGDSFVVGSRPLTQDMNDLIVQGGIPPSMLPPENATYSTSDEWYTALADVHFALLTFQHNNAIDSDDDCRDKFVARHLFRQLVRQGKLFDATATLAGSGETSGRPKKPPPRKQAKKETFRLWMDDLRPSNILLDADLNIVGVVDWEWTYFAPCSFVRDPPWWLLLGRPDYWDGGLLDFRDKYTGVLDVFFDAVRAEEDLELQEDDDEGWSLDQHIETLSLDAVPLSERMRQNWESGAFWANYAARRCYGFEPTFWEFVDKRFFGPNVEGGYEGRMNLLSEKVKRRMESFVDRKVEESKEKKLVDWDPEEARAYLAEILADLD